jgi:hypothetical protein
MWRQVTVGDWCGEWMTCCDVINLYLSQPCCHPVSRCRGQVQLHTILLVRSHVSVGLKWALRAAQAQAIIWAAQWSAHAQRRQRQTQHTVSHTHRDTALPHCGVAHSGFSTTQQCSNIPGGFPDTKDGDGAVAGESQWRPPETDGTGPHHCSDYKE